MNYCKKKKRGGKEQTEEEEDSNQVKNREDTEGRSRGGEKEKFLFVCSVCFLGLSAALSFLG